MKDPKATEKPQDTPEVVDGVYVLQFSRPFIFEDEEYKELTFDFNKCNGRVLMRLADRLDIADTEAPVKQMNLKYLALVCAESAGVPFQLIEELPGGAFGKITMMAQGFLLSSG